VPPLNLGLHIGAHLHAAAYPAPVNREQENTTVYVGVGHNAPEGLWAATTSAGAPSRAPAAGTAGARRRGAAPPRRSTPRARAASTAAATRARAGARARRPGGRTGWPPAPATPPVTAPPVAPPPDRSVGGLSEPWTDAQYQWELSYLYY
jgi:hypothetical protein